MRIIIISDNAFINSGVVSIIENTLSEKNACEYEFYDFEFEYYLAFSEFWNKNREYTSQCLNDVKFIFYCYNVSSVDSRSFVNCLDNGEISCPVVIYTPVQLTSDYIGYLLRYGVHSVITPRMKECKVAEILYQLLQEQCHLRVFSKNVNVRSKAIERNSSVHVHSDCSVPLSFNNSHIYGFDSTYNVINPSYKISYSPTNSSNSSLVDINDISLLSIDYDKLNVSLSPRKQKLIQGLILGLSNKELANRSNLSLGTVRNYIHQLACHFEVSNRTELALKLRGLLDL